MKIKSLIAIVMACFLTGCATFIPSNPSSNHRKKELVRVSTVKKERPQQDQKYAGIAAVVIPMVVEFAVTRTVAELRKESELYSASWTGFVADDEFYYVSNSEYYIALEEIIIKRYADGNTEEPAFEAQFQVVPSQDGLAFRLIPLSVLVTRSKAKLVKSDNDLDVDVRVEIEALYSNNEKIAIVDVGTLDIPLRGLKLGEVWKPADGNPVTSQWFPAIPISKSPDGKLCGTGNYVVKVLVKEHDDFGERVKKVADVLEQNKGKIVEQVKPR